MIGGRSLLLRACGRHLSKVLRGAVNTQVSEIQASECMQHLSATFTRNKSTETPSSVSTNLDCKIMSETKEFPTLNKLGLLDKKHIQILDPGHVDHLLSTIIAGGFNKMQVIADHDRTLSRAHYNNEKTETCHGIMDNSPLMPPYYREEASKLLNKYYPIEVDPIMTEEEKTPHMVEWYGKIHTLLIKCGMSRTSIATMVKQSNVRLRDGTEDLFSKLKSKSVPVLVFSAGMGDILEEVLRHFNVYDDNVKVVSNFFEYDEQGNMIGFKGEIIHVFNKNENAVHESDYFKKIGGRNNVILLGDSLGDIKMAHGVPQPNNVLKIGFLNDKIEERMEMYKKNFDIVLVDDQTMEVCNRLIDLMMK
ncbi:unnamed protein product [Meganyctiphanes norvegica]|uniref:5'-nucleotidase n=1 Tax=Meganyctiphanes norvegica TaxID=48144 RepID=A0AAV2PQS9_MEGNR